MQKEDNTLQTVQEEPMETEELMAFLSQMAETGTFEEPVEYKAPAYLKEQILERASKPDVQAVIQVKETSRKAQLFLYGLKTVAAVAAALLMLVAVSGADVSKMAVKGPDQRISQKERKESLTEKMNSASNEVTGYLNQLFDGFVNGGNGI